MKETFVHTIISPDLLAVTPLRVQVTSNFLLQLLIQLEGCKGRKVTPKLIDTCVRTVISNHFSKSSQTSGLPVSSQEAIWNQVASCGAPMSKLTKHSVRRTAPIEMSLTWRQMSTYLDGKGSDSTFIIIVHQRVILRLHCKWHCACCIAVALPAISSFSTPAQHSQTLTTQ